MSETEDYGGGIENIDILLSALRDAITGASPDNKTINDLLTELKLKAELTETQPVSAATLPLPSGAATETMLATLSTETKLEAVRVLIASLDGKDFATQTTLAALLTELQGKADLDETQPVSAAALPLPSGAGTSANQTTMITALQLIDDLRAALGSVATDLLRVESKDGDKIFAFESIVEEKVTNTNLSADINTLNGGVVASGKVWKITQISCNYTGTPPSGMFIYVPGLAIDLILIHKISVVSNQEYMWSGEIYMQVGDYIRMYILGATAGDDATFRYAGVQMNAP